MKLSKIALCTAFLFASSSYAALITYTAALNGANESPVNASPGTGAAVVTYDTLANTLRVQVNFTGLLGTVTASHIHCCTTVPGTGTAGVATATPTFPGFPSGVTFGTYDQTFDLTAAATYNPAFVSANGGTVAAALPIFVAGLANDQTYLNIHTTVVPGGEIRGFLVQQTPEPATFLLSGVLLAGGLLARRKIAQHVA